LFVFCLFVQEEISTEFNPPLFGSLFVFLSYLYVLFYTPRIGSLIRFYAISRTFLFNGVCVCLRSILGPASPKVLIDWRLNMIYFAQY
jgi:hypothetical protein